MKFIAIKNHKISFSQTHNLEVIGSSPGWSTLKISNLEEIQVADFSFCENNAKTIGLSSVPFYTSFRNLVRLRKQILGKHKG